MGEVEGRWPEDARRRPRGEPVGAHRLLGETGRAAVRQPALDHRPCDGGLSGQLWTRRLVGELIAKLHRLRLTVERSGFGGASDAGRD